MLRTPRALSALIAGAALALGAGTACGTTIQDLVRIKGHEQNVATGLGIVVGLNGTGDKSRDSYVAARPFQALLENLGNPVADLEELRRADAYAVVQVSLRIPGTGVREGDRLDVAVDALFNAKSLDGGRLVFSPLRLPGPDSGELPVLAYAEGSVVVEGVNPRAGTIAEGGQMLVDIRTDPLTDAGTVTLVVRDQYAGYPVTATIASAINDEFALDGYSEIAIAEDAKNIHVMLPPADRPRPARFMAALMTLPIDPSLIQTEARIVINDRVGSIVITGNVEIGPVAIAHRGMTISSITPPSAPEEVGLLTRRWAGIDTSDRQSRSSTRLVELLAAFDQLNIEVADQISIIYELKQTGQLHAEVIRR